MQRERGCMASPGCAAFEMTGKGVLFETLKPASISGDFKCSAKEAVWQAPTALHLK